MTGERGWSKRSTGEREAEFCEAKMINCGSHVEVTRERYIGERKTGICGYCGCSEAM